MEDRPTSLAGLEVDAQGVDRRVDEQVARCLEVLEDAVALRQELGGLAGMKSQRAEFAFCLFSLDLARLGEPEARAGFARHAGILLEAHRDPDLTRYLLGENAELQKRWEGFVPLLLEFDSARSRPVVEDMMTPGEASLDDLMAANGEPAPSMAVTLPPGPRELPAVEHGFPTAESEPDVALDASVDACYAVRTDVVALSAAMESLAAFPPTDRVELTRCIFNLELVRLGVEEAKAEFASRTGLLLGLYRDRELAHEIIRPSEGLLALWEDLVPYLEEFFEGPDDEYEIVDAVDVASEEAVLSGDDLLVAEAPPDGDAEEVPLELIEEERARPPPPPPQNATPPPGRIPSMTPGKAVARRNSSPSVRRLSIAPRPPPPPAEVASPETLAFWAHAEKALGLLPDENGMLSGKQAFDLGSRDQRTGLKHFAREVLEKFPGSPEARAMGCLSELYLAAHQKEKTLFGKPNEKRHAAIQEALALLAADPEAAGHAAVLFENDGVETIAHFAKALVAVHQFLGYCARNKLDPLSADTVQQYKL